MGLQLELALTSVLYGTESYTTIPVASLDDVVALVHDQDWHVKLLDASVDLLDAVLCLGACEPLLAVASERERCRWIQVMCPRQPDEVLHEIVLGRTHDPLVINEFGKQDGLLVDSCSLWLL